MHSSQCIFVLCIYAVAVVHCKRRHNLYKRDTEDNEHHLLNILKDHDIIPDILDDATETNLLEVRF